MQKKFYLKALFFKFFVKYSYINPIVFTFCTYCRAVPALFFPAAGKEQTILGF